MTRGAAGSPRSREILQAAAELFDARGFHATTIDDVGAAVGITGPALYRYFRGKSELLSAVFGSTMDYLLTTTNDRKLAGLPPDEALDTLIDIHVEYVLSHRSLMHIVRREVHSLPPDERQRFRENQQRYLQAWAYVLRRMRHDVDDAQAVTMVAGAVALANRYARRANEVEDMQLKRMVMAMVRAALLAPMPFLSAQEDDVANTVTAGDGNRIHGNAAASTDGAPSTRERNVL